MHAPTWIRTQATAGRQPVRPSRYCGPESVLALSATETGRKSGEIPYNTLFRPTLHVYWMNWLTHRLHSCLSDAKFVVFGVFHQFCSGQQKVAERRA